MKLFAFAILALSFMTTPSAYAKSFATSYLQIDLPDNWDCKSIEKTYACQVTGSTEQRTAVIVITAKQAGPQDHLSALRSSLKLPRAVDGAKRSMITSKLEWEKELTLGSEPWVESLHSNREIEGFYTYYLATVARGLTIVLSFSFQNTKSKEMQPILNQIRSSLKLIAKPIITATDGPAPVPVAPQAAGQQPSTSSPSATPGRQGPMSPEMMIGILVGLVAVAFLLLRRKK